MVRHLALLLAGVTACGSGNARPAPPRYADSGFPAIGSRIDVSISGVDAPRGHVVVALYDHATWLQEDKVLAREVAAASADEVVVRLMHVPKGRYAIAVLDDANDNGKLDFGLFGPEERYGFSREARATFGPPSFDAAAFDFDGTQMVLRLTVK
jgi:uncharacterized protein (DUF2141 family)